MRDVVFFLVDNIFLAMPLYVLLQAGVAFAARPGGWRIAALAPLVLAVPVVLYCGSAFLSGAGLWPLPFLLFAPIGVTYLIVLALAGTVASLLRARPSQGP